MRRSPIPGLVLADGWLAPFEREIKGRMRLYDAQLERICRRHGSLMDFAHAYTRMGFNRDPQSGEWIYREWAPGARALYLIGDFNAWNRESHPMQPTADGVWELRLPATVFSAESNPEKYRAYCDFMKEQKIPLLPPLDQKTAFPSQESGHNTCVKRRNIYEQKDRSLFLFHSENGFCHRMYWADARHASHHGRPGGAYGHDGHSLPAGRQWGRRRSSRMGACSFASF